MKKIPNIADCAYSPPTEYLYGPFQESPFSQNYFGITNATKPKEVGRKYPQVDKMDHEKSNKLDFDKLNTESIVFNRVVLFNSAKATDFLSCVHLSSQAYLLSKKAMDVFKNFNLGNHTVYPATVYHKEQSYEYVVLHLVNEVDRFLDYENSRFTVESSGKYIFDVKIKDYEELQSLSAKVKSREYPNTPEYSRIILTKGCFKNDYQVPDLFSIFCAPTWYFISRKLGQAILQNNLSGFEFQKVYELMD